VLRLNDEDRSLLKDAVTRYATDPELVASIQAIYVEFEAERLARQPRCDASGRCCRFEEYGHRLFISTAEVAAFIAAGPPATPPAWDGTGCPYQVEGLCTARDGRPFGCRVYFCDPSSKDWQTTQYERFHASIRELHERRGVPYVYAEWRDALAAVGLPSEATEPDSSPVGKGRIVLTVVPSRR
jgi:hypothetical protein